MATKRTLKKNISRICGAIAADAMLAAHLDANVDRKKIEDVVRRLAALQEGARAKVTFWYDKTPRDFGGDKAAYNKARRTYFRQAFDQLRADFNKEAMDIIKELNEAVPADVRKVLTPAE